MAHGGIAIGRADDLGNIGGDHRLGIEHAVRHQAAGEDAGYRFADREDDMRLTHGIGMRVPFRHHRAVLQHHQRIGEGEADHLLERQRPAIRRGDRQAREIARAARQARRPPGAGHPDGGDQLANMVEGPAIVRRLAPVAKVRIGSFIADLSLSNAARARSSAVAALVWWRCDRNRDNARRRERSPAA